MEALILVLALGCSPSNKEAALSASLSEVGVLVADREGMVAVGGDIDGDGAATLLQGSFGERPGSDSLWHRLPTAFGAPDVAIASSEDDVLSLGQVVAGGGDLDGDGVADVVLGTQYFQPDDASLQVVSGADLTGPTLDPASTDSVRAEGLLDGAVSYACSSVSARTDLDGDGFDDLLFSPDQSTLVWILGPVTADRSAADVDGSSAAEEEDLCDFAVGDLDGDGHPDLLIGGNGYGPVPLLYGPDFPRRLGDAVTTFLPSEWLDDTTETMFGGSVALLSASSDGGDGAVFIGAPWAHTSAGDSPGDYAGAVYGWADPATGSFDQDEAPILVRGASRSDLFATDLSVVGLAAGGGESLAVAAAESLSLFDVGTLLAEDAPEPWLTLSLEESPIYGPQLAAGDLDGDGREDLVVAGPSNEVSVVTGATVEWLGD